MKKPTHVCITLREQTDNYNLESYRVVSVCANEEFDAAKMIAYRAARAYATLHVGNCEVKETINNLDEYRVSVQEPYRLTTWVVRKDVPFM